jgi:hypothetical protein
MEKIKSQLIEKWEEISNTKNAFDFSVLRFNDDCEPDFYIGINENNNKCILHSLVNVNINFEGFEKTNLKAYKNSKYLILELIDNDEYLDLFLDLSYSIFEKIKYITIAQDSALIFKEMILRWSAFFTNKKIDKLGEKQVMGLWGELFILKEFIEQKKISVDDILIAWRGPYNGNRDFEFDNFHLEIKSIKSDSDKINISSEFQLEDENGIEINLRVLKLRGDSNGQNLNDIVQEIILLLNQLNADLEIFYSALFQIVRLSDLNKYDDLCFAINSDLTYLVIENEFPLIDSKTLMEGLSNVKYKIALNKIENFLK